MAKAERIQASQVFDTEEVAPARYVVRIAVGPYADLVVLSLDAPPDYRRTAPSGASFAKLRADHMNCYRIDHFRSGEWSSLALAPTNENFHFAGLWTGISVKGSHAFAVSREHALLAGGYSKRNRLFLVDFATSKVKERIPVDVKGQAIEGFAAFGRGNRLWLQAGSALFVVDLPDEDN